MLLKRMELFLFNLDSHKLGKELREKAWGKFIPTPNDNLIKKSSFKTFWKAF